VFGMVRMPSFQVGLSALVCGKACHNQISRLCKNVTWFCVNVNCIVVYCACEPWPPATGLWLQTAAFLHLDHGCDGVAQILYTTLYDCGG
jgi:hypothetical protein